MRLNGLSKTIVSATSTLKTNEVVHIEQLEELRGAPKTYVESIPKNSKFVHIKQLEQLGGAPNNKN